MLLVSFVLSIIVALIAVPLSGWGSLKHSKADVILPFVITFIVSFIVTGTAHYFLLVQQIWENYTLILGILLLFTGFVAVLLEERRIAHRGDDLQVTLMFIVAAAMLLFNLFLAFYSFGSASDKYNEIVVEVEEQMPALGEETDTIAVPHSYAVYQMNRAFSQVPDNSFYELDKLYIQEVKGDIVYVASLKFSTVFRWVSERELPGYLMLSATDINGNVEFVNEPYQFAASSYFGDKAKRVIRSEFPSDKLVGDLRFEIDNEGKPYFFIAYGDFIKDIGRVGKEVEGIILLDAATGDVEKLELEEVPNWVSSPYPSEMVNYQTNVYGKYVLGFWNNIFSKRDVKLPSDVGNEDGVTPMWVNDEMYYFTDYTTPNRDVSSLVGYSLTNARTGEITYYSEPGSSLMDAKGAVNFVDQRYTDLGWRGATPILYNINGESSWLVSVLSAEGNMEEIVIVSGQNRQLYVNGKNPEDVLREFRNLISSAPSGEIDIETTEETENVSILVERVFKTQGEDGILSVYILSTEGDKFYTATNVNPDVIFIEVGDALELEYIVSEVEYSQVKDLEITFN